MQEIQSHGRNNSSKKPKVPLYFGCNKCNQKYLYFLSKARLFTQYLKYIVQSILFFVKIIGAQSPMLSLLITVLWNDPNFKVIFFIILLVIYFTISIFSHAIIFLVQCMVYSSPKNHRVVLKYFSFKIAMYGGIVVNILDSLGNILIQQCNSYNLTTFLCLLGYIDLQQRYLNGVADSYYSQYLEIQGKHFKGLKFWQNSSQEELYEEDSEDKRLTINLLEVSIMSSIWTKLLEGVYSISMQFEDIQAAGNVNNAYLEYAALGLTYFTNAIWIQYIRRFESINHLKQICSNGPNLSSVRKYLTIIAGVILDIIKVSYTLLLIFWFAYKQYNEANGFYISDYYTTYSIPIQKFYKALNLAIENNSNKNHHFLNVSATSYDMANVSTSSKLPVFFPTNQKGIYVHVKNHAYYLGHYQQIELDKSTNNYKFGAARLDDIGYKDFQINTILQNFTYEFPESTTIVFVDSNALPYYKSQDSEYSYLAFQYYDETDLIKNKKQNFDNMVQQRSTDLIYQTIAKNQFKGQYLQPYNYRNGLTPESEQRRLYSPLYLIIDYYINPQSSNCYQIAKQSLCKNRTLNTSSDGLIDLKEVLSEMSNVQPQSFNFSLGAQVYVGMVNEIQGSPYDWTPEQAIGKIITIDQMYLNKYSQLDQDDLINLGIYIYDDQAQNFLTWKDFLSQFTQNTNEAQILESLTLGKIATDPGYCATLFCNFPSTVVKKVVFYGNILQSNQVEDYPSQSRFTQFNFDYQLNSLNGPTKVLKFQLSNTALFFDHIGDVKKTLEKNYNKDPITYEYNYRYAYRPEDTSKNYSYSADEIPQTTRYVESNINLDKGDLDDIVWRGLPIEYLPFFTHKCEVTSSLYDDSFCYKIQTEAINSQGSQDPIQPSIECLIGFIFGSIYLVIYICQFVIFSQLNFKYMRRNFKVKKAYQTYQDQFPDSLFTPQNNNNYNFLTPPDQVTKM